MTAVKFAHHFAGPTLACLVNEMVRVARRRVIILDIRRHRLAYWGFTAWSRVFTTNRLVRFDGPLSVLRGFTRAELLAQAAEFPELVWKVRAYPGFQLALVGRRQPRSGDSERTRQAAQSFEKIDRSTPQAAASSPTSRPSSAT